MKQLLGNSQNVFVARTPRPALPEGWVLVRTRWSMISPGTELAPLRAAFSAPEASPARAAEARIRLLAAYLGKAARHPRLAAARAAEILNRKLLALKEAPAAPADDETGHQGWGLGYSASGEVSLCGPGVTGLSPGQPVACCGAGWANHAEFMALPRLMVRPVPPGCSLEEAASATLGAIALQGVRRAGPGLGERVAVLGLGLIGQLAAQLLKASGCRVFGYDLNRARVEKARSLGLADGSADLDDFSRLASSATDGRGFDRVLVAAAAKSSDPVNQALALVRPKGAVVLLGEVGLNLERPAFYRKEADLLMSTSYGPGRHDREYELEGRDYPYNYVRWTINRNLGAFMEQVAAGAVRVKDLIERSVPVERAPEVYRELAAGGDSAPLGVLISYPGPPDEARVLSLRGAGAAPAAKPGPARTALVGVGAFGVSMLVPRLAERPEWFTLAGVVSSDAARGGNYARQAGLALFSADAAEMAARPEIDFLVVATRHHRHPEAALAALRAGKAVFVEKPLAITWESLAEVEDCHRKLASPPLLTVGFNRRFAPALEILREELAGRRAPLMMLYRVNAGFIPRDHWLQTEEGGGRNLGEACHMYDVFRSLAGSPPVNIQARAMVPESEARQRSDHFTAALGYEDGSQATLFYTAAGPKTGLAKERLEVFCDGEAWILDDFRSLTRARDQKILWQGKEDKGHRRQFELLGRALAGEGPPPLGPEEIFETTALALQVEDLLHGRVED